MIFRIHPSYSFIIHTGLILLSFPGFIIHSGLILLSFPGFIIHTGFILLSFPELKTLEWDILNPNRFFNMEINNTRRTRKRVDQALIPICTIQKFPAQVLSFSLVSSFLQFSFHHLYWFHSCTVFHDLRFIFFSGFRFELILPVTFFQFLQTSSLFRDS